MASEGNGTTVANAYVQVMPSAKGIQAKLTNELSGSLNKAGLKAGKSGGSILGGSIVGALGGIKGKIIGALGVGSIIAGARQSINAFTSLASSTKQLQRVTGGTAEEVSKMAGAMRLSGMDTSKANASLTIFARNMTRAASGSKTQASAFESMGVSVKDAHGKMLSMAAVLPKVADKFAEMPDGAEKTAAAVSMFGRSGTAMLPFLNKGSAGIAELEEQAKRLGITLDDQAMGSFGNYKAETRRFETALEGVKVKIGSALLPIVTDAAIALNTTIIPALTSGADAVKGFIDGIASKIDISWLTDFISQIGGAAFDYESSGIVKMATDIQSAFDGLINAEGTQQLLGIFTSGLTDLGNAFIQLKDACQPVIDLVGEFATNVLVPFSQAVLPTLIAALTGLMAVLAAVFGFVAKVVAFQISTIATVVSAIGGGITAIIGWFMSLPEKVTSIFNVIISFLSGVPGTIVGFFTGIGAGIAGFFSDAYGMISGTFTSIVGFVSGIPGRVVGFFTGIGGKILSHFDGLVSSVNGIGGDIRAAFEHIPDDIVGFFTGIGDDIASAFGSISLPQIHIDGGEAPWGIGGHGRLPSFSLYANGGLFTHAAVFGEKGREYALPLNRRTLRPLAAGLATELGVGGNDRQIVINSTVNGAGDPEAYAMRLTRALNRQLNMA